MEYFLFDFLLVTWMSRVRERKKIIIKYIIYTEDDDE